MGDIDVYELKAELGRVAKQSREAYTMADEAHREAASIGTLHLVLNQMTKEILDLSEELKDLRGAVSILHYLVGKAMESVN